MITPGVRHVKMTLPGSETEDELFYSLPVRGFVMMK